MNSALGRLRRAFVCSLLTVALFAASPLHAQDAAGPAKINVTVQPTNGTAQKTTCAAATYKCSMDVPVQAAGKAQTLTVDVFYVSGGAIFNFKTADGYLYAGAKTQADPQHPQYTAMWGSAVTSAAPSVSDITLYEPFVSNAAAAPFRDTPGKAFADLQVTLEAAP